MSTPGPAVDPTSGPGGVVGAGTGADPDRAIPAPRSRRRSLPVLLVGLLFLFGPALSFVLGERPAQIENRKLAAFPSLDSGWSFFGKVNTWAIDHLPLRDRAVSANTRFSESVFGETPQYGDTSTGTAVVAPPAGQQPGGRTYPRVVPGKDGWLFFGGDFSGPCQPKQSLQATLDGLDRFARIVQRSGHRLVFTIPPDKSSMNADKLPSTYLGSDCAPQAKERFWKAIGERPPPAYVDLRQPLADLQARSGENLWRPSDSHWAARGAAVYAEQVVTAIAPGLWRAEELRATGPSHPRGDLSVLLGAPHTDTVPGYDVVRSGVTVVRQTQNGMASTGPRLIPGRTLILGDSFTQASRPLLAPFFSDARIVHPKTATADPAALIRILQSSDTIVLEVVERSMVGGDVPITDKAFLDRLEAALR